MDVIWHHLFQMKSSVHNNYRFRLLFKMARLAMVVSHSNGGIERVYALINKNKNEGSDRNTLVSHKYFTDLFKMASRPG